MREGEDVVKGCLGGGFGGEARVVCEAFGRLGGLGCG